MYLWKRECLRLELFLSVPIVFALARLCELQAKPEHVPSSRIPFHPLLPRLSLLTLLLTLQIDHVCILPDAVCFPDLVNKPVPIRF
jgi:hypothetical protein